ncbi:hypothetical protein Pan181_18540 [Aeoliella mucimassa]|uniref:Uncharacterized protein n=1 Tax=Aeoliella mucimassa TaxID=2527972 RepID=A0A518ALR9_9BACT|nr:hypothetical protein Pan181_18540 [Aeoliella mucimassa]
MNRCTDSLRLAAPPKTAYYGKERNLLFYLEERSNGEKLLTSHEDTNSKFYRVFTEAEKSRRQRSRTTTCHCSHFRLTFELGGLGFR